MILYITLCIEFFKIGLFAVGGGLATVPFLFDLIDKYHWFTKDMLANMIAVSESTPGAMGVNMATYVGFHTTGSIIGAIITTLSLVAPSIVIITIIAHYLQKFKANPLVQYAFYGIRPVVCALIASVGLNLFITTIFQNHFSMFNLIPFLLFIILFFLSNRFKKLHPIFIIIISAILGILLCL